MKFIVKGKKKELGRTADARASKIKFIEIEADHYHFTEEQKFETPDKHNTDKALESE